MVRKISLVILGTLLLAFLALPANADGTTVATGLKYPRGLCYDDAGNLFIAEAGTTGDIALPAPPDDEEAESRGPMTTGGTGQISMVAPDGTQTVLVAGLPSTGGPGDAVGVAQVYATADSIWFLTAGGPPMMPFSGLLVELDRATQRVKKYIDVSGYEAAHNPDGNAIDSNPVDFKVAEDGTIFIVDAGGNDVLTWTEGQGLQVFHTWPDNPVPTSIDFAPDGSIYVGFLGTQIAPGAAHIEHWSRDGQLIETFGGMTALTDVLVTEDGTVYAVLMTQIGEQGPVPNSGSVVTVTADGVTPVAEGLNLPYGIAQTPDGHFAVSINAAFVDPTSGAVVILN